MIRRLSILTLLLALAAWNLSRVSADTPEKKNAFFLRDGDTVVFLGDSITAQRLYGQDIENYVVTRFPRWRVRFINSGWSGDMATGGPGGTADVRLKRDVLPYKPTVVTLFFGMNDGYYTKYDAKIRQLYAGAMAHLVDTLKRQLPGVRFTILTPSYFDYDALPDAPKSGIAPDYNETLIRFGDFLRKFGAERHIPVVELNAPLREVTARERKTNPKFTLTKDGIHPNAAGSLLIAAAVLRAWNAPPIATKIELTSGKPQVIETPLPWPVSADAKPALTLSPLPGSLNRFTVSGKALTAARYTLKIDGKPAGEFSREQWIAGIPLTETMFPAVYTQAKQAAKWVEERSEKWRYLAQSDDNPKYPSLARYDDKPTAAQIQALVAVQNWLNEYRERAHAAAQPRRHTFALQPILTR